MAMQILLFVSRRNLTQDVGHTSGEEINNMRPSIAKFYKLGKDIMDSLDVLVRFFFHYWNVINKIGLVMSIGTP